MQLASKLQVHNCVSRSAFALAATINRIWYTALALLDLELLEDALRAATPDAFATPDPVQLIRTQRK